MIIKASKAFQLSNISLVFRAWNLVHAVAHFWLQDDGVETRRRGIQVHREPSLGWTENGRENQGGVGGHYRFEHNESLTKIARQFQNHATMVFFLNRILLFSNGFIFTHPCIFRRFLADISGTVPLR